MEPRYRHVEREEVIGRCDAGLNVGNRRLKSQTKPLLVVEKGERDGSGTTGIGGVIAETIEHKMGVLTFILSRTDRRK